MALRIAVVGGTGPQGKGLGYRFARHGHDVWLGSRSPARAHECAATVSTRLEPIAGAGAVVGTSNHEACDSADIVLIAVPYDGHDELVSALPLTGRVVVSCVNPLSFDRQGPFGQLVGDGEDSAAESAQRIAQDATVVGAFHHVSAVKLWGEQDYLDEDILVCGDSKEAKELVQQLASTVTGRSGIDAGRLRMARQLEPLTAVLISINKAYKTHAGVQIVGV